MQLEKLYSKLPTIIQKAIINAHGWKIKKRRYGGNYKSFLNEIIDRSYWSYDQLINYQNNIFKSYMLPLYQKIPFYINWFKKHTIDFRDINSIEDIQYLPILTKSEVQKAGNDFLNPLIKKNRLHRFHTSGTTGAGLIFHGTRESEWQQWATWWRYFNWHGIKFGTWCAYFGGRSIVPAQQNKPPFWRINIPGRQVLFSAYHINSNTIEEYLKVCKLRQLRWWHGYPSTITLFCQEAKARGIDFKGIVKWITLGTENLWSHQSKLIEDVTGIKPIQHYGEAEMVANISMCPDGSLHVDEDFSLVEFKPQAIPNTYKVIGTSFVNNASPFLHYDTGDIVTITDDKCNCGRSGRIITVIDGRSEDYVIRRNGSKIGRMDHIFKDMIHVKEAQIIQKQPGNIDVLLCVNHIFSKEHEKKLFQEFFDRLGNDMNISFRYLDKIPRTAAGKLRFVVNEKK